MRRIASVVLVLLCLNVACPTAIGQSPIKSLTYPPEFSAEQILNGNLPRPHRLLHCLSTSMTQALPRIVSST